MNNGLPQLPIRPASGHKGTFGTVAVLGGSCLNPTSDDSAPVRMFGGAALAALAALRSGCGLARLLMPEPVLNSALTIAPVATGVPLPVDHSGDLISHRAAACLDEQLEQCHALVIGPALGNGDGARSVALRAASQDRVPVVIDADAINRLSEVPNLTLDFKAMGVLTPHPGEFRRLAAPLGITLDPVIEAQRPGAAEALAQKLGAVVVLKGDRTIITDGHQTWIHDDPNPALATGGSGDVLSGVIAGLIAQHHRPGQPSMSLYDLARIGVAAHAAAARLWCSKARASGGMLATDLLEELPEAVESLRARA